MISPECDVIVSRTASRATSSRTLRLHACCSTRWLYSSRIVALLLTFCFEPCLAVVLALSRTLLYSVFIFWKGEFEFELGLRPMLAAERSDRERW